MTRKRRYLISAAVFVACVCIALGVFAMMPRSGVTKANYDRIEKGMTFADVEKILGNRIWFDDVGPNFRAAKWRHDNGAVATVVFRDDEVVADMNWTNSHESFTEKVRRWLGIPVPD